MRADAQRNRARVLEAARTILSTEGLSAPIDHIAAKAGVGVGTIYRHFPTQESLYEAVLLQGLADIVAYAKSFATADDPGAAFFRFLERLVEDAVSMKAIADALAGTAFDMKAHSSQSVQELEQSVATLLKRAQRAGAVRKDVHAPEVLALVTATCIVGEPMGEHVDPKRQAVLLTVILDGLRATTPRAV